MKIRIEIELDPAQHKPEQLISLMNNAKFAAEGAVGETKMESRPRRDFDYEITAQILG